MGNSLVEHLSSFSEQDWLAAVEALVSEIHEVDQNAVRIWFRFYPLELQRFIASAEDRDKALHGLAMQGRFELKEHIDSSHHFLYGHRFWAATKCKIEKLVEEWTGEPTDLVEIIKDIGMRVSKKTAVDRSLTNGIAAVGLMTLNQVGLEAFTAADGTTADGAALKRSPDQIVADRAKDDSQGLLGFLKTINKRFSVFFSSLYASGRFTIINEEEIVTASQKDHSRDWQAIDERCWDGPVPIECTSASCGTCWVGVLGGQEKLTEVGRRERRQMKVFGYNQPEEAKPLIRLACQARAQGNVTIVIPPWNAVFGKKVYGNVEALELEPVTTSAKQLRETVKSAISSDGS